MSQWHAFFPALALTPPQPSWDAPRVSISCQNRSGEVRLQLAGPARIKPVLGGPQWRRHTPAGGRLHGLKPSPGASQLLFVRLGHGPVLDLPTIQHLLDLCVSVRQHDGARALAVLDRRQMNLLRQLLDAGAELDRTRVNLVAEGRRQPLNVLAQPTHPGIEAPARWPSHNALSAPERCLCLNVRTSLPSDRSHGRRHTTPGHSVRRVTIQIRPHTRHPRQPADSGLTRKWANAVEGARRPPGSLRRQETST